MSSADRDNKRRKIRNVLVVPGANGEDEQLDLYYTRELQGLPDEIGNLANLNKLDLNESSISSLPGSIGQLQNLEELDLSSTIELQGLPDEIGNLANLNQLNLSGSNISSLPGSIGQLQNLRVMTLQKTPILQDASPNPTLWNAVRQSRLLGCIDCDRVYGSNPAWEKLNYCLTRNRARSRVVFGNNDSELFLPPALWPLILCKAERAFDKYSLGRSNISCGCCIKRVTESEAIFQLLIDRGARDVFLQQN